ncbi:MAG: hypothetical protein R3292_10570 [Alcanivorax sp.]|nr:hypothetical protein [Alcanivorax sp.]
MSTPSISALKVFVPCRDFDISLAFYQALGWQLNWCQSQLAEIELNGHCLLLQDFYVPQWADNFMVHLTVADADHWHRHVSDVLQRENFGPARVEAPRLEPQGARVTHVWDPSGVLLQLAQLMN